MRLLVHAYVFLFVPSIAVGQGTLTNETGKHSFALKDGAIEYKLNEGSYESVDKFIGSELREIKQVLAVEGQREGGVIFFNQHIGGTPGRIHFMALTDAGVVYATSRMHDGKWTAWRNLSTEVGLKETIDKLCVAGIGLEGFPTLLMTDKNGQERTLGIEGYDIFLLDRFTMRQQKKEPTPATTATKKYEYHYRVEAVLDGTVVDTREYTGEFSTDNDAMQAIGQVAAAWTPKSDYRSKRPVLLSKTEVSK